MPLEYSAIVNGRSFNAKLKENQVVLNGEEFLIDVAPTNERRLHTLINNKSYNIELISIDKAEKIVVLKVNGNVYRVTLEDKFDQLLKRLGIGNLTSNKLNELRAPMPGLVVDICVKPGDTVAKGDPLLVLEAMKMENILKSPGNGKIKKINVIKGQAVEKNVVLVNFE